MDNSPMLSTPFLRPNFATGTYAPVTPRSSRPASHRILTFPCALPKFHLVICWSKTSRGALRLIVLKAFLPQSTQRAAKVRKEILHFRALATREFGVQAPTQSILFSNKELQ